MKKILLTILTFLVAFSAFSQKQKVNHMTTFDEKLIHFGFTLGLNALDFGLAHYNPIGMNPDFEPVNWPLDKKQIVGSDEVRADVSSLIPGFFQNAYKVIAVGKFPYRFRKISICPVVF